MKKHIVTIRKSAREEVQVALDEFTKDGTTHQMFSARVYYDDGGEMKPGRNGVNLKIELLPALIEGLREAEAAAREAESLKGEGAGTNEAA